MPFGHCSLAPTADVISFHHTRRGRSFRSSRWQSAATLRLVLPSNCGTLDGSLKGSYISVARCSKQTGQPVPLYSTTVQHQDAILLAAVRDFVRVPLGIQAPLPEIREESRILCRELSRHLTEHRHLQLNLDLPKLSGPANYFVESGTS